MTIGAKRFIVISSAFSVTTTTQSIVKSDGVRRSRARRPRRRAASDRSPRRRCTGRSSEARRSRRRATAAKRTRLVLDVEREPAAQVRKSGKTPREIDHVGLAERALPEARELHRGGSLRGVHRLLHLLYVILWPPRGSRRAILLFEARRRAIRRLKYGLRLRELRRSP